MNQKSSCVFMTIIGIMLVTLIVIFVFVKHNVQSEPNTTWPESVEFSQLESGQDRFSIHDTNIPDFKIIVDHQTGIEYLYGHDKGMAPLLNTQGEPLRVFEAG